MADSFRRDAIALLSVAFLLRLLGISITAMTNLNTYSHSDAVKFSHRAASVVTMLSDGTVPSVVLSSPTNVWGTMLSPFWLLTGPSRTYARIGVAVLGCMAVYNVYVLGCHLHSRRAGIFASIPLVFYPSFVMIHSTVLRESLVLFGLTTATRLLVAPSSQLGRTGRYGAAAVSIVLAILPRIENVPVYLLVLSVGAAVSLRPWRRAPGATKVVTLSGSLLAVSAFFAFSDGVVDRLSSMRDYRARGRTEYLDWVVPDSLPEMVAFSWIGAAYFLFTPFLWSVVTVTDAVVALEAVGNVFYAAFAVVGVRLVARRSLAVAAALATGIVVGSVLYGIANANVGTVVRQRQMILWAIFLFGGVGIAETIHIRLSRRSP